MSQQASLSPAKGQPFAESKASAAIRLGAFTAHLAAWIETCADYYRAAALYDQLSGLSDAELHRYGLNRATLAWTICQAYDRTNG